MAVLPTHDRSRLIGRGGAQLNVVSLLGARGPLTLTQLSRELELSHSTVSGIVDRLQAKGVVQREPSPTDRRYVTISLAPAINLRAQTLIKSGPGSRLLEVLAAAPPADRRTIRDGLALFQGLLRTAWDLPGRSNRPG